MTLLNLTPDGRRDFVFPQFEAPIHVFPKKGEREDLRRPLDTVVIEPDLERVTMTWRVARPLEEMFEISQVLVGRKGREWWQERERSAFPIPIVAVPIGTRRTAPPPHDREPLEGLNPGVVTAVGLTARAS